ncbi:UTRA domain-containing protein [Vibrio rhizosphaerae]|uniref:UTRA domain-containing protein n=1 Tax=Vibrio rhizosphaerae TaxID=398736 RepID=A0ABU4IVD4_9VIBR|nr:UTRA domain-containing protein [Vibrio rhizosphaerae]MDW6093073.1 UTRA domain-containing protein [Vibrio rhizosphaerae]
MTQLTKIKDVIREQIRGGTISSRQKLPSERELCALFSTTRITVKDSLASLETEGLIYREERRGWFVSPPRIHYNPLSRSHFHQMISEQNRIAETHLIQVESRVASSEEAKLLARNEMTPLHIIRRLRLIDGRVVLYVENCLIAHWFPGILEENLTQSLTGLYREKYGYVTSRSRFDVISTAATPEVAKALNIAAGQQVLKICRVNYKQDGAIIDCEFEYWRPDAVMITIDSHTDKASC